MSETAGVCLLGIEVFLSQKTEQDFAVSKQESEIREEAGEEAA